MNSYATDSIYWTEKEVWFRCDVRKVFAGTNDVEVEYVVAGWPLERHCLADVRWEPWSEGNEVDVRECEYDGESYMGPMDVEAQRAAENKRKRGQAGVPGSSGARGDASTSRAHGRCVGPGYDASDEDAESEHTPAQDSRDGSHDSASEGRFGWVMAGIRKGIRNKQRRALAQCIVDAWSSLDGIGGTSRVSRKELYRRCSNIGVKPKEIGMELVAMKDAGLVVRSS